MAHVIWRNSHAAFRYRLPAELRLLPKRASRPQELDGLPRLKWQSPTLLCFNPYDPIRGRYDRGAARDVGHPMSRLAIRSGSEFIEMEQAGLCFPAPTALSEARTVSFQELAELTMCAKRDTWEISRSNDVRPELSCRAIFMRTDRLGEALRQPAAVLIYRRLTPGSTQSISNSRLAPVSAVLPLGS
jgi:hypothetical protein